jgi:ABC-type sugar transport system ATPase subunit
MKGVEVRLEHLSKHFGRVVALRSLDLEVRAGELVAFLGPSGCGKTTTLLLIAGIYRPTTGAIYFGERRVDGLHPRDRDVGMVFQSYALYPHLTLFENIAFPLRVKGRPEGEVRAKVRETAELLGIGNILDRRPGQVSGGQQQRAALARALVKEPQVLLLDEPLSNLDAQVRVQARAEIRRLQRELGVTTILVTHDQAEALAMADRVAVFSAGEVQQYATPLELYERPCNTFVAGFVGHPPMNVVRGRMFGDGFEAEGWRCRIPRTSYRGEGYLGVRPEDVRLGGDLEARVLVAEPLGRDQLVTVRAGATELKLLVGPGAEYAPDSVVRLEIPPERVHLFDGEGRRIG